MNVGLQFTLDWPRCLVVISVFRYSMVVTGYQTVPHFTIGQADLGWFVTFAVLHNQRESQWMEVWLLFQH